jgi:acyl carrier protein
VGEVSGKPTRDRVLGWIDATLRELEVHSGGPGITEETGLFGQGIGLDSIEVLQIVSACEEEFEMTVEDEDLTPDHFRTVGSLIRFILARLP